MILGLAELLGQPGAGLVGRGAAVPGRPRGRGQSTDDGPAAAAPGRSHPPEAVQSVDVTHGLEVGHPNRLSQLQPGKR
jgi:hypothetical protein